MGGREKKESLQSIELRLGAWERGPAKKGIRAPVLCASGQAGLYLGFGFANLSLCLNQAQNALFSLRVFPIGKTKLLLVISRCPLF